MHAIVLACPSFIFSVAVIFLLGFNYLFWNRMVTAARVMHQSFADRLMRAPMSFFEVTPIGRILNRASSDVDIVDNMLPLIIRELLVLGFFL
jgi:ABC-type multidrug transport system fused ATPase/permease subunit